MARTITIDLDLLRDALNNTPVKQHDAYLLHHVENVLYQQGLKTPPWMSEAKQKADAKKPSTSKTILTKGYSEQFERSWAAFPSRQGVKTGKAEAFKAWVQIVKGGFKTRLTEEALLQKCLVAIEINKKTEQWKEDNGKYIPMASTCLNRRFFEDTVELPEENPDDFYQDHNGIRRKKS